MGKRAKKGSNADEISTEVTSQICCQFLEQTPMLHNWQRVCVKGGWRGGGNKAPLLGPGECCEAPELMTPLRTSTKAL